MSKRVAEIKRQTSETDIELKINLDGQGQSDVSTGLPFLDHMLTLFSKHGGFDLTLRVKGDIEVDGHHTTEDVGICLGQAVKEAVGDADGICRYASALIPMDESLCQLALDICNRSHLTFNATFPKAKVGEFDSELVEEFFNAFVNNARVTLHLDIIRGQNLHHMIESTFKAFGVVLSDALSRHPRRSGVPSTKGIL